MEQQKVIDEIQYYQAQKLTDSSMKTALFPLTNMTN